MECLEDGKQNGSNFRFDEMLAKQCMRATEITTALIDLKKHKSENMSTASVGNY